MLATGLNTRLCLRTKTQLCVIMIVFSCDMHAWCQFVKELHDAEVIRFDTSVAMGGILLHRKTASCA